MTRHVRYAEAPARVVVRGRLVGHVRLALNERAGLDATEVKNLAESAAKAVATVLEARGRE